MLRSVKNVYCSNEFIASISFEESTWYEGITPRYLRNVGYLNGVIYGRLAYLNLIRRAYKLSNKEKMKFFYLLKWMYRGLKEYYS